MSPKGPSNCLLLCHTCSHNPTGSISCTGCLSSYGPIHVHHSRSYMHVGWNNSSTVTKQVSFVCFIRTIKNKAINCKLWWESLKISREIVFLISSVFKIWEKSGNVFDKLWNFRNISYYFHTVHFIQRFLILLQKYFPSALGFLLRSGLEFFHFLQDFLVLSWKA